MAFLDKNFIFRPYFELEAIARQSVEASREVICAYFGNIGRNSGYFPLPIFLAVHPTVESTVVTPIQFGNSNHQIKAEHVTAFKVLLTSK